MIRDPQIRAALHAAIDQTTPAGSVVVDEYGIHHACVADVAVFQPDSLHLFEIKSDVDSTRRLKWQAEFYSLCGPTTCTLVAGPRLLLKAMKMVPWWWGAIRAEEKDGAVQLERVRATEQNPMQDLVFVARALWSTEAWEALKDRGWSKGRSKLRGDGRRGLLAERLTLPELRALIFDCVKTRKWMESRTPVRLVGRAA